MPWSGSGVFNRIYSWASDKAAGIDITASRMDTDTNDIVSNGFGNTLTRDGQGSPTANLPMNGYRHTGAGVASGTGDYVTLGQVAGSTGNLGPVAATSLTASGAITAGTGLTVSAGGAVITGSVTISAALSISGTTNLGTTVLPNNVWLRGTTTGASVGNMLTIDGSNNVTVVNTAGNKIRFLNNGQTTETFSVDNSGNAAVAGTLTVNGVTTATNNGWVYNPTGGGAYGPVLVSYGILAQATNVVAAAYYAVSDARLKTGVAAISDADGESWVRSARPVTYEKGGKAEAGFIAQEQVRAGYHQYVGSVPHPGLPGRVDPDGFVSVAGVSMTLNYENYIAYLAAALRSALRRIDALERACG